MTGPYEKFSGLYPLYILQFDKSGNSTSPVTTAQLLNEVRSGAYTQIYLFSHGWNNDFGDALSLYRDFFNLFLELRAKEPPPDAYKPVFIGLHWPSIILLMPWEKGPRFAAESDNDAAFDSYARVRDLIAEDLPVGSTARFYELTGKDHVTEEEAQELADILAPLYRRNALDAYEEKPAAVDREGIIASWLSLPDDTIPPAPPDYTHHGRAQEIPPAGVRSAGVLDFLDPRNAIRVTTVLKMKDRAGSIGRMGLAPLLGQLIPAAGKTPIRLIGHSYGARVCLTALSSPALGTLKVASLLLLQPAVNQYCFAPLVPDLGMPGGFVPALSRVGNPVYSTFSSRDIPNYAFFHLAARRTQDLGEVRFAAEGPSVYSALGGYGPAGMIASDVKEETIHASRDPYKYDPGLKVLALDGSADRIKGHGDVRTDFTCWALLDQEIRNVH